MRAQSISDSPLNLYSRESEIVDAVSQSEKCIPGEPVENRKLRYFNSFEFFDHTSSVARIQVASILGERYFDRPSQFPVENKVTMRVTIMPAQDFQIWPLHDCGISPPTLPSLRFPPFRRKMFAIPTYGNFC